MSEETREPVSNYVAREAMEPAVKKRQTGQALVIIDVIMLTFCLVAVLFVPSDLRAGHDFWSILFAIDVVVAAALIAIGTIQKSKVKSRLNV